jgi:hypothetical protein
MKLRFGDPHKEQKARVALDSLTIGTMTLHDYVQKFELLSQEVAQAEVDKLYRFMKGLRPDLVQLVMIDPAKGRPFDHYDAQRDYALTFAHALAVAGTTLQNARTP